MIRSIPGICRARARDAAREEQSLRDYPDWENGDGEASDVSNAVLWQAYLQELLRSRTD